MERSVGTVCAIVVAWAGWVDAANDAQYIDCVIPDTVITDQTFDAQIRMKNTGDAPWGQGSNVPVTLVSQTPVFNLTWGTYFIILGQGNTVAPGDTFTFRSPLKAPSTPGTYNFGWQCQNWLGEWDTTTAFFGEVVTGERIVVTQRQETPPPPPVHRDSLLDTSDLEYVGSFKLQNLDGFENLYTESGLALRTMPNGDRHLLLNTGTYDFTLYELSIPPPITIVDGDHSGLNTATVERVWGDLSIGTVNSEEINSNAGFWFDDSTDILYWCHNNSYFTGGPEDFPVLMATRLNGDGSTTQLHAWHLPSFPERYKSYWGGVTRLSQRFADAYTGGRTLGMGYGGYYSICGTASRGPALGAVAVPDTTQDTVDLVEMMSYPDPAASPRDGNYLPQVGFWNDYALSPWEGFWTYDDYCRSGVFVDLPDKHGYLAFVQQVTGRIGYDYGGYNTDGHTQDCWYFYDIDSLGAAAQGARSPSSIVPSSYATVQYPLQGGLAPGACFDEENRLVYVYVQWSIDGREPVVHVYRVREGDAGVHRPRAAQVKSATRVPYAREMFDMTGRLLRESGSPAAVRANGVYLVRKGGRSNAEGSRVIAVPVLSTAP